MVKIKVNEASGPVLDWLVAKCWWNDEFDSKRIWIHNGYTYILNNSDINPDLRRSYSQIWKPSTDWAQGGPVIEQGEIDILMEQRDLKTWAAEIYHSPKGYIRRCGPTPLIAAMRCYVASKLGEEVEVPDELLRG